MGEAEVIINGQRLTDAQVMAVRAAISTFEPDCGQDEQKAKAYKARINEVCRIICSVISEDRNDAQRIR